MILFEINDVYIGEKFNKSIEVEFLKKEDVMANHRRTFLKNSSMVGAAAYFVPSAFAAKSGAFHTMERSSFAGSNTQVNRLGFLGAGGMGIEDTKTALLHNNIELRVEFEQWNHMKIRVVGDQVTTWLNGEKMVEFADKKICEAKEKFAFRSMMDEE